MSASLQEIQVPVDQILDLLDSRMKCGQMVIHLNDGLVTRVETNTVHKPAGRPLRKA